MRSIWQHTLDSIQKDGYLSPEGSIFGITIPAGAATEWARSILGDDKRYLAGDSNLAPFYKSWQPENEIISVAFEDDITLFSRNQTVPLDAWCDVFTRAKMTRVLVTPEQYGKKEVGHMGMFKDGQSEIWEMLRDIIVDGKIPDKGDIRRWNQGKARL
jgi:predicted alpha/beta hydrolase